MSMNAGNVIFTFKGDASGLTDAIKQTEKDVENFASGIGKSIDKGINIGIGAVAGVVATATTISASFEQQMSKVQAISGATADEMTQLAEKAQEMGAKTKFSASESGQAFEYMAMAGWKTSDMLNGIEGIMNLAAASGEELASVSDIVTDALTAFGLQASDSAHFADVLAKASSNSNTNVSMMGATFKYVAPLAGSLGYSIEDTAVAIGLMANAGIKGEQAGTALRATLTRLAKPPADAAAALETLGISITNSDGTIKPLNSSLIELREKFSSLSDEEKVQMASAIAGQEAMSGFLAIINASDTDFNNLASAIANSDGTAKSMADTMNNNLNGQITLLKSALEGVAIEIGTKILPSLTEFITKITEKISTSNWDAIISSAITLGKVLLPLIATLKAYKIAMSVANTVTEMHKSIQKVLEIKTKIATAAINAMTIAQKALNFVMNMNPITLIIIAIVALVAAFALLWNKCDWFKNFWLQLWQGIKLAVSSAVNFMVQWFNKIINFVKENWQGILLLLVNPFAGAFKLLYDNCEIFRNTINNFIFTIKNFFINLVNWFAELPYKVGYFIGQMLGNIINFGINAWNWINVELPKIILGIIEWFSKLPENVWNWLVNTYDNVVQWSVNTYNTATQWISSTINGIISFFSEMPEKVWFWLVNTYYKITTWIINTKNRMVQGVENIINSVVTYFSELPGKIQNIGVNLVTGLWNGICNAKDWLIEKVKEFAGGIIDGIKDTLGIHSPSTVMFGIGVNLDKGYVNGIESMETDIDKAFSNTFDISPQMKANTSSNYSSNVVVNVNNNMEFDPLGQMINKTKTFSNGSKNSYNYGMT